MADRILIVDDDAALRDTLAEYLKGQGFAVSIAGTGEDALREVGQTPPDLALVDLVLPDMHGSSLLKHLRERHTDLPVVMLTGHASVYSAAEATRLGAIDYIVKPCDVDLLTRRIHGVLAVHRLRESVMRERQSQIAIHLAAGVCHNFNNKLTSVIGYSMLLGARTDLPADVRSCLTHIARAGTQMAELVAKLGYFCRAGTGAPKDVPLRAAIEEVALASSLRYGVTVALEIGALPEDAAVFALPAQIAQLFSELIANACEASRAGGKVVVSARLGEIESPQRAPATGSPPDEVRCTVTVDDDGPGLPKGCETAIFHPFFSTRETPGRGMGLAAAQGIVAACGGELTVLNRPEGGVRATVTLPARTHADPIPLRSGRRLRAGACVLVVDDEANVRAVLRRMLEVHRLNVRDAANADQALEVLSAPDQPVDMVFLDMIMPGCNGMEAHRRIRAARPAMPVLLMSGFPQDENIEEMLRQDPATGFLPKPFSMDQLHNALLDMQAVTV